MRRFIRLLLALLFAPSAILAADGKTFEDAQKRFHLTVPPAFIATTQPDNPKVLVQLSPAGKQSTESVQVRIESTRPLPNIDLDRLADEYAYQLKRKDMKAAETTDAKVGALPAKRIIYGTDAKKVGAASKGAIYLFIVNDWAWCIDIHAGDEAGDRLSDQDFNTFRAIGEQVVSSFALEANANSQLSSAATRPTRTVLSNGLSRYAVASEGYSIDVPGDWVWTPIAANKSPLVMLIRLPLSGAKGKLPTALQLIVQNGTPDLKNIAAATTDSLKKQDPNVKVEPPVTTTLGGEPAMQMVSVATLHQVTVKTVHVICNHDGKQFSLGLIVDPELFDEYWPAAQAAIASFHFSK